MVVAQLIYESTKDYPRYELFGLTTQTRRCAVSIPCNIAEGYGRRSTKDYIRFLNISMGSLNELITLLELANALNFVSETSFVELDNLIREIERMLSSLINKIQSHQ